MRRSLLLLLVLGACDPAGSVDETDDRRRPRVDAATTTVDAAAPSTGDSTGAGVISCYRQGLPSATCNQPQHCCFDNYSSHHNGYCTTSTCAWGTLKCDGPEDCGSGLRCCVTAHEDPEYGIVKYDGSCKASCGGPPLDHELCHPNASTCAKGSCVTAYGNANDLPRTLYVCK